ncbi:MAG: hypothetical protein IPM81_19995 [Saprospirales bacterium]|nr:hypothetical protein [Saprospirales bacterium]
MMKLTDRASKLFQQQLENDQLNRNFRGEAAEIINGFLQNEEKVSADDLVFLGSFLRNSDWHRKGPYQSKDRKLVSAVFDHYYPRAAPGRFYHFTTFDNFRSIVDAKELRLCNLLKRKSAEFFNIFYDDHGLKGYERNDTNGKKFWEKIMQETFYVSFANCDTLTTDNEATLWRNFAEKGLGVRLQFQITPRVPDFRFAHYRPEELEAKRLVINQLSKSIWERFERVFTVSGISKMGAFYLDCNFQHETEVRLVLKANTDDYPFRFKPSPLDSKVQFIRLPFSSKYASIRLVSVQPGIMNKDKVREVISKCRIRPKPTILDNITSI